MDAQVTPWASFNTPQGVKCKTFSGGNISMSGLKFEGSPVEVYWNGYIDPFLKKFIEESIELVVETANSNKAALADPLEETARYLESLVSKTFERMSEIDQLLRANGYPESVARRDTSMLQDSFQSYITKIKNANIELWKSTLIKY